jgi:fructuronate reductase
VVAGWVEEWWDAATRHLTLPGHEIAAYRAALLERFSNPQIRHLLAQIAADGSQKVPIRAVPVLLAERKAGFLPEGVTRFLAAWIAHLRGHGVPVTDARAGEVTRLATGTVAEVLAWLGIDDVEVATLVERQVGELVGNPDN